MNKNNNNLGFTLVELMIVVAIIGIVSTIAVPSFQDTLERNRLKEALESLKSDLMFAKTEAIKQSKNIRVSLEQSGSSWCYGIYDATATCDAYSCATGAGTAVAACKIKLINGAQFKGISLNTATNTSFGFRRGTATNIGPELSSDNYEMKVVVSGKGRVRICHITGSSDGLPGYNCT